MCIPAQWERSTTLRRDLVVGPVWTAHLGQYNREQSVNPPWLLSSNIVDFLSHWSKANVTENKAPSPKMIGQSSSMCCRMYCDIPGLSWPTGPCDGGWYCTLASEHARPADPTQGGRCQPGYYCPNGSSAMVPCVPGSYCDAWELIEPTGLCQSGFYCLLESTTPSPTDGIMGRCGVPQLGT